MAATAETFLTDDSVGNREDLSDFIFNVYQTETPILTAISRNTATAVNHEWQTVDLEPIADNHHPQGDEAYLEDSTPTERLGNYLQVLKKGVKVSRTLERISKAGRKSEISHQKALKMKAIKRDMEKALCGKNTGKVAPIRGVDGISAPIQAYLTENVSAVGADPTGDGTDGRTDGAQRVFDKQQIRDVQQLCYENGGEPTMLCVGTFNRGVFSDFTGRTESRYTTNNMNELVDSVKVYKGDFGDLTVSPSIAMRARDALLVDPEYLKLSELGGLFYEEKPRTGDFYRGELIWEATLEVCSPRAHGIIADLTTS